MEDQKITPFSQSVKKREKGNKCRTKVYLVIGQAKGINNNRIPGNENKCNDNKI